MRKTQEIFERIDEGVYALKAWSPEQKSLEQQQNASLFPPISPRMSPKPINIHQTLTGCLLDILETASGSMSPAEIRGQLRQSGRPVSKEAVTGALSRLAAEKRVDKPAPGRYVSMNHNDNDSSSYSKKRNQEVS